MPLFLANNLSPIPLRSSALLPHEPALSSAVADGLRDWGIEIGGRVVCAVGEPDIISAAHDLIVEVKHRLTRKSMMQAIGQVLLYRQCINPEARVAIAGYPTPETFPLLPYVLALGFEVYVWQDEVDGDQGLGGGGYRIGARPSSIHHIPTTTFRSLSWNIQRVARARDILSVSQLATLMHRTRQALYPLWNGTAKQISLDMLAQLVQALNADPRDWFRLGDEDWELGSNDQPPSRNPYTLHWNIRARAEALGLDPTRLSFKTEIHMRSIVPIWNDMAQAIAIETLGKLAQALDVPESPFLIGLIFVWKEAQEMTRSMWS